MFRTESEPVTAGRYDHLPHETAQMLGGWSCQGVRPSSRAIGPVMPSVVFTTIDLKLPETGPAKILEINGTTSGLSGLERIGEGLESEVRFNLADLYDSLGLPRARFRYIQRKSGKGYFMEIADEYGPYQDHIAIQEGLEPPDMYAYDFDRTNRFTEAEIERAEENLIDAHGGHPIGELGLDLRREPDVIPRIHSIEEADALLEINEGYTDRVLPGLDDPNMLTINPAEVRALELCKMTFSAFCNRIGANRYRPRSSTFFGPMPEFYPSNDLRHAQDIGAVVLKTSTGSGGRGVMHFSINEFRVLSQIAERYGSWAAMAHRLSGDGFGSTEEAMDFHFTPGPTTNMVLEEYIPSKIVEDEAGRKFDATMRVATATFANKGRVTVVPLAGYWKLPRHEDLDEHDIARGNSDVKEGGSLPVSDEDFRRAFRDSADFMKRIVHHSRSLNPRVNRWPERFSAAVIPK